MRVAARSTTGIAHMGKINSTELLKRVLSTEAMMTEHTAHTTIQYWRCTNHAMA